MSLKVFKIGVLIPNTNLIDLAVILNEVAGFTTARIGHLISVADVVMYRTADFNELTGFDLPIGPNVYGISFDTNDQLQLISAGTGSQNVKIHKIANMAGTDLVNITDLALVLRDKAGVEMSYLVGRVLTDEQEVVMYKVLLNPQSGTQSTFKLSNKKFAITVLPDGSLEIVQI